MEMSVKLMSLEPALPIWDSVRKLREKSILAHPIQIYHALKINVLTWMENVVTSRIASLIHVRYKMNVLTQSVRLITVVAAVMFAMSMGLNLWKKFLVLTHGNQFVVLMVSHIRMIVKPARSMPPLRMKGNARNLRLRLKQQAHKEPPQLHLKLQAVQLQAQ